MSFHILFSPPLHSDQVVSKFRTEALDFLVAISSSMEDSDDDIPLQVLAKSAGWGHPISGERKAFKNSSDKGIETLCQATPLLMSASCTGRDDVFKTSTGHLQLPNPLKAVGDQMQLLRSESTDEANLDLCSKKTKAKKMKIQEERKANDIMTCFQRRYGIKAELPAQDIRVSSSTSSGSGIERTASGRAFHHSSQTS